MEKLGCLWPEHGTWTILRSFTPLIGIHRRFLGKCQSGGPVHGESYKSVEFTGRLGQSFLRDSKRGPWVKIGISVSRANSEIGLGDPSKPKMVALRSMMLERIWRLVKPDRLLRARSLADYMQFWPHPTGVRKQWYSWMRFVEVSTDGGQRLPNMRTPTWRQSSALDQIPVHPQYMVMQMMVEQMWP